MGLSRRIGRGGRDDRAALQVSRLSRTPLQLSETRGQLLPVAFVPVVKRRRVEVGVVGPDESVDFGVNAHLIEQGQVTQRAVVVAVENGFEVDDLLGVVVEEDAEGVVVDYYEAS